MGSLGLWHWLIVLVVVLLLFGKGRISSLMGDLAQGVKAFKKGMAESETDPDADDNAPAPAPLAMKTPPDGERA